MRRCAVASRLEKRLETEMEWAIALVSHHGQPGSDLASLHAAMRTNSPMLHKRFKLFLDNSRPWDTSDTGMTRKDTMRLGHLLMALEARAAGNPWELYQPGEHDMDRGEYGTVLQIRCAPSFKLQFKAFAKRTGHDMSEIVRTLVERYMAEHDEGAASTPAQD